MLGNKWYVETEAYWIIAQGTEEEVKGFMAGHSPNEPIQEIRPATLVEIKKFYILNRVTYYNQ